VTAPVHAVSTTGIYCRPDCSASPLPRHVSTYAHPAAAEAAGFRACHRCRPYRTSDLATWLDAPELVCRAVRMVVEGALDGATEIDLAARLGVSARHLRRLFETHMGLTPDQLARSRRAHFARRLLDDTDLPVVDIATAAGYGSSRQLARELNRVFRAGPSELRSKRRHADRLVADGGLRLRLPFAPPLDWAHLLGFLAERATPGVEAVDVDAGIYLRTISVGGAPGVLAAGPPTSDALLITWHLPRWDGLTHLNQRARRLFDLDADPADVLAVLGDDPIVSSGVHASPGRRVPGAWEATEIAVRAVAGQQVTVRGATTIMGRLVERFGSPVGGLVPMGLTATFPTAEVLAEAGVDAIASCGLPRSRAAAIAGLAGAVVGGDIVIDGSVTGRDLHDSLTGLAGIGPWTAGYVAMRLGDGDAYPRGDLALRRRLARWCGIDEATPAHLDEVAEIWRPRRAHAAIHLWSMPVPEDR